MVNETLPVGREPLLPGEEADSEYRDDAEHWIRVYEELLASAGELAANANGARGALEAAQGRYRRRLAFWRRRAQERGGA
jgi:hypothetical protein